MTSRVYMLFEQAMRTRKQIVCVYDGGERELCAVILGHSDGLEKALTYQFAGKSKSGLPPGGEWRCLFLSKVSKARLRDGLWQVGYRTLPYHPDEVTELYLGASMKGSDKADILAKAKALNPRIKIFQVKRSNSGHISFDAI